MNFDFEKEQEVLSLANDNIHEVLVKYNEILMNLSDREKYIMQLYYYFKKLDTFRSMTPKGHYWDNKRDVIIQKGLEMMKKIGNRLYPDITDLEELRSEVIRDMNGKLQSIISDFSKEIKNAYREYCDYVYTVLPIHGLKTLEASKHRENQHLNCICNGIFASASMNQVEKYIASANVSGMVAHGNKIEYPSNPFSNIDDNKILLIHPVSIYLIDSNYFEPQFDYEVDSDGVARFIYGGEWIAPCERLECIETQTTYLPSTFLNNKIIYYVENGEKIQIQASNGRKRK